MTDLTSLSAGFATIGQGAGPMMVTWSAGLFAKHGLAIERPRIMGGAKGVVRGLMSGEIQFGNMAAPAPLRANLKGEADVVFLTGGINQQFIMGRPGINSRQELGGKKIRKRQAVMAVMAAANRDPNRFPDPDRLDITRRDNRHVAFGYGAHFCFGAPLARIEGQIAFEEMIRFFPQWSLEPGPLVWRSNLGLRGLTSLGINLTSGGHGQRI